MSITVTELIEKLQKFDGNLQVLQTGSSGWNDVYDVELQGNIVTIDDPETAKEYVILV